MFNTFYQQMETYELNVISTFIKNTFIIIGFALGFLSFVVLLVAKFNPWFGVLLLIIFIIAGIVLGKTLCKARAVFTIQSNSLSIQWVKKFKVWEKKDLTWRFSDMEEYVIDFTTEIVIFKIKKTDWTKLKLEFEVGKNESERIGMFLDDFTTAISKYNIKTGKGMWETTGVKMLIPVIIIFLIWLWNNYLSENNHGWMKLVSLIVSSASLLVYVYIIYLYNYRKK